MYQEKASGVRRDQPELAAALDYMREGDTLIVLKLDRLACSTRQLIETIENLQGRDIGIRCLTQDGLDTTTPGGRLIFQVFAAMAEFERETILERTRAGLDAAWARGRIGGRPRALSEEDLRMVRSLLRDPEITVAAVAWKMGVAPATLHRHIPGGRGAVEDLA